MRYRYIKYALLVLFFIKSPALVEGQNAFLKILKAHQVLYTQSPGNAVAEVQMSKEDAFYFDYNEYYYIKRDITSSTSAGLSFYNSYALNYYKVINFNIKIQTPYALHNKTFFSTLHQNQEEIIAFVITDIKPDGRKFITTASMLKEITLGLYSDEDFEEYLVRRMPSVQLEVGDVVNYFIITRSKFSNPQQTIYLNEDFPVVDRTLNFYIDRSFGWQFTMINCNKTAATFKGPQYSELHYSLHFVKGLQNKPYVDMSSRASVILTINSYKDYYGDTHSIMDDDYGTFAMKRVAALKDLVKCKDEAKEPFEKQVDSIISEANPQSIEDTLKALQTFINKAVRIIEIDTSLVKKSPHYQFIKGVITPENIVPVYAAMIAHLKLTAYVCFAVPRQMGKINSSFFYLSPYYEVFIAVRKGLYDWYYLMPPTADFKYKVNFIPYYIENSGFVAARISGKRKESPLWVIDATRNLSAVQNVDYLKKTIHLGEVGEKCTIQSSGDYYGQSAFYRPGLGSQQFKLRTTTMQDSVAINTDIFTKYGQLPENLVIINDTDQSSGRYRSIEVTLKVPSMICPMGDSLYFIPFDRLVKYRDLQEQLQASEFDIDLGFPFLQRSDINLVFPWDIQLENAEQYPMIKNCSIGKIQFSVIQSGPRNIRVLSEITMSEHLIPKHNYYYLSSFNNMIYKVMANALVVRRN